MSQRGFFGVAVWRPKTTCNVGTLWRTAHVFDGRYLKQASDTTKAARHVPLFEYAEFDEFRAHLPKGALLVGCERADGARDIVGYHHPESAVYLLGPEDGSLAPDILKHCDSRIVIPGLYCLNLAVAGSIVLYDRIAKAAA